MNQSIRITDPPSSLSSHPKFLYKRHPLSVITLYLLESRSTFSSCYYWKGKCFTIPFSSQIDNRNNYWMSFLLMIVLPFPSTKILFVPSIFEEFFPIGRYSVDSKLLFTFLHFPYQFSTILGFLFIFIINNLPSSIYYIVFSYSCTWIIFQYFLLLL